MLRRAAPAAFAILVGWSATRGNAASAPLPPDRPPEFGRGQTPVPASPPQSSTPPAAAPTATPAGADATCLATLRALGAVVQEAPSPADVDPACRIETPLRLLSVADPTDPKRAIAFPDSPLVACRIAAAFAPWIAHVASPVLRAGYGAPLKAVRTGPGFECRSRNRQAGGKPSAHGLGLAVDIAAFDLTDGSSVTVAAEGRAQPPSAAFSALRISACGSFTTVLGPGADPFHADHLHVDLQRHGSSDRYRICQ